MMIGKKLGIWMDHSRAHLMEYSTGIIETHTINSDFTDDTKKTSLQKGENNMHTKEQHQQAAYYHKISTKMLNYDEVILFGPTQAKVELLNICKADHHFDNIQIDTQQTDKMTENQQHSFVKDYYTKL